MTPPPHPVRRRGRRALRTVGLVIVILLAVLLGAFAAVAFVAKRELDQLVTPRTAAMRKAQRVLEKPLPGRPTNILVLGSDHRVGDDATNKRSDTLLLVRLDPRGKTISMLSFPRDLYVDIPGHGKSKINDAYSLGGPALSVETIKELTGVDVNFVMNVDFAGFRGVVDALDGVWVDVDRDYFNDNSNGENYAAIDIDAGYQRLMGRDALSYARFRHTDTDFHRIARQQQLLAAMKRQVSASKVAGNAPGLLRVLKKNVEIAGGGGNGVPTRIVYDYLRLALKLDSRDIYQVELKGGIDTGPGGASIVVADEATMTGAVDAFLRPDASAREKTADQVAGPGEDPASTETPEKPPVQPQVPEPADTSVRVLNGSGMDGAAGSMAEQLRGVGYDVSVPDGDGANADTFNYANTVVQYRRVALKPAAEALAARIDGASAKAADGANQFDTKLLVIVGKVPGEVSGEGADGSDEPGTGGGTPYDGNNVPEKGEADVVTDAEYGRDDFADAGRRGVRVLYPTVRESSSTYEEVRGYRIAKGSTKYGAYRLVARTATRAYWGLQGTSWPDPPLLESPTREVRRGGRTYELFFNGTKLHIVAWHERGGTYWVSNSVLDELSNETMLAIAEGVQPLG